jgi:hypothetical protein
VLETLRTEALMRELLALGIVGLFFWAFIVTLWYSGSED